MIKVLNSKTVHPMYTLYKRKFTRPSMYMQADMLDFAKAIAASEDDIKNGRLIPAEEVFKELRELYGY